MAYSGVSAYIQATLPTNAAVSSLPYSPTTNVSFGSSSKKHFCVGPSMKKYRASAQLMKSARLLKMDLMAAAMCKKESG